LAWIDRRGIFVHTTSQFPVTVRFEVIAMIDCALQRTNMVESQIRPSDVTDRRILRAMAAIPRERFVPQTLAALAYMDEQIALHDPGARAPVRAMMSPRTFAKLIQLAQIEPADRVLDVGAGRGYGAAVLARMAATVVALENDQALASLAKTSLQEYPNVSVVTGALDTGASSQGTFDVIVMEGATHFRPDNLLSQLNFGGRLVAIYYDGGVGQATVWRRDATQVGQFSAFEAAITALPGFGPTPAFNF
jgi:protein-L-isoaspartate(D-aspartate) O-methyltransferase